MLTEPQLRRIFRFSAWYDLVVTAAFATPWTFLYAMALITETAQVLNLPGQMISPDVFHVFFANLLGSIVLVWSVARLKINALVMVRYDAVGRLLFSIWMIYALANGASYFVLFLLVPEAILAVLQALPIKRSAPPLRAACANEGGL